MSIPNLSYLSQEEKDKIKEEVIYRESLARSLSPDKGLLHKVSSFLAHPAFVTVLGGVVITWIGANFQQDQFREQLKTERQRYIQDKKLSILSTFPAQIHKDFTLLYNRTEKRHFLFNTTHKPKTTDSLGRSRDKVMVLYEKLVDEDVKSPSVTVMLADVKIWYCDPNVIRLTDLIDNEREKIENLSPEEITEEGLRKFNKPIEKQLRDLTEAMSNEVHHGGTCEGMMIAQGGEKIAKGAHRAP